MRAAEGTARFTLEEKLLIAAITLLLVMRLAFSAFAFPIVDESYYWLWGRHLALSYYDHAPLQGWLQGLSYQLFGRNLFALRWLTWLALAAELWIFYKVAVRLAGDAWRPIFLRSTAVFLSSPLFGFFSNLAFNDYLLVVMVMGSGYFFMRFFADIEEGKRGQSLDLFAAAVLLGLAALAKYNGGFLGVAVAATVLVRPQLRRLLLDWRLYAAAALAIGLQAPVLIWNMQEGFASFLYQMGDRHGTRVFEEIRIFAMKAAAGEQLILLSAFLIPTIIRFFWATQRNPFERIGKTMAIWTFWLSTIACLVAANLSWILFWWNIVAYVLIFPFAGRYTRPVLMTVHILYGTLIIAFMTVTYWIVPVLLLVGARPGMDTERNYGWPTIVAEMLEAKESYGADFLMTNRSQASSQIAWALDDPDIVAIQSDHTAFDDWFDPGTRTGQSAIVLEHPHDMDRWQTFFAKITPIGQVPVEVRGTTLMTYNLYFAEGFKAPQ